MPWLLKHHIKQVFTVEDGIFRNLVNYMLSIILTINQTFQFENDQLVNRVWLGNSIWHNQIGKVIVNVNNN